MRRSKSEFKAQPENAESVLARRLMLTRVLVLGSSCPARDPSGRWWSLRGEEVLPWLPVAHGLESDFIFPQRPDRERSVPSPWLAAE